MKNIAQRLPKIDSDTIIEGVKAVGILLFILFGLFCILDRALATTHRTNGVIVDSSYTRASSWCDSNAKCTSSPERCQIYVKGDGHTSWSDVPCSLYFRPLHLGDTVTMLWKQGRWSNYRFGEWSYIQ